MPNFVWIGKARVNADHIVSIEPKEQGRGRECWAVTLVGGRVLESNDPLEEAYGTIVPAPPGLVVVQAFPPEPFDATLAIDFFITPVIAFRLVGKEPPIPIGLSGEPSPAYKSAVIQPDGQCIGWGETWDSLDAFKAGQQALYDAQRQPAVNRPAADPPQTVPAADRDRYEQAKAIPTAPETVEQLRDRILAEPIQALVPDASWQPGRTAAEVIAAVRDANPQLHYAGLGHDPKWGWKWKPGDMERHRADMTDEGHAEEFDRALRFLSYAGQRFGQTRVNSKRTSYSWKHVAERVMGAYVSNGMLVAAAYALGFTVVPNDTPNPCINLGEKAALLDPDRGL